ncbi:hypothetical protein GQX74_004888 [Glossina fuscipes]|nr:hypothetical protein GQX74_004888 [Glossina fuscipes]
MYIAVKSHLVNRPFDQTFYQTCAYKYIITGTACPNCETSSSLADSGGMNKLLSPALTRSRNTSRLANGGSADNKLQESKGLKEMISSSITAQQANIVALIDKQMSEAIEAK